MEGCNIQKYVPKGGIKSILKVVTGLLPTGKICNKFVCWKMFIGRRGSCQSEQNGI